MIQNHSELNESSNHSSCSSKTNDFLEEFITELDSLQSAISISRTFPQESELIEPNHLDSRNDGDLIKMIRYPTIFVHRHPSFYQQIQRKIETINPLSKEQSSFSDLPGELIHIILCYYTHSFKDLIKFSTINKTCKQISDHSLLWLEVKLMFYPPQKLLFQQGHYYYLWSQSYEAYLEDEIRRLNFPALKKQLLSHESVFPPVYKVEVPSFRQDLAQYRNDNQESDFEIAYRISQWWKGLFVRYQQLYHRHVKYVSYGVKYYLFKPVHIVYHSINYVLFLTACVGIISIYLLFDWKNTNLSLENKIGLYMLLGLIGFYMVLHVTWIMICVVGRIVRNKETLLFRFRYYYLNSFDLPLLLTLTSIFIGLIMVLLKCDGSLGNNIDWWETALPLWISLSIVYGLWYYEHRKIPARRHLFVGQVISFYVTIAPCLTCTLIACYYDSIYIGPFQYTLLPLYPVFFLTAIVALGYPVWSIGNFISNFKRGWIELNPLWYFALHLFVLNMTNISIIINCWSVIMLLIDSYRIDDNDWDKKFFSVHFTPLTCFLIFLFSIPCFLLGLFAESKHFYQNSLEDILTSFILKYFFSERVMDRVNLILDLFRKF